jgi:hypothetical protein
MKAYFVGIIVVAFFGGVVVSVLPTGATQKYLRLLCGLCISASIIVPIFSFLASGEFGPEQINILGSEDLTLDSNYDEIYNRSIGVAQEKNLEKILKNEIIQRFGAKFGDFDLDISIEEKSDEFYISSSRIEIHASGIMLDPNEMKKYVEDRLSCSCEVVYAK